MKIVSIFQNVLDAETFVALLKFLTPRSQLRQRFDNIRETLWNWVKSTFAKDEHYIINKKKL